MAACSAGSGSGDELGAGPSAGDESATGSSVVDSASDVASSAAPTPEPESDSEPNPEQTARSRAISDAIAGSLDEAVQASDAVGGTTNVSVWVEGDPEPMSAGDQLGSTVRLWSTSKAVVAVAALDAAEPSGGPSSELTDAMTAAIAASDNCAQRRVTLGLQQLTGGIDGAQRAVNDTLAKAGVTLSVQPQRGDLTGNEACRSYLAENSTGISDPFATALLFGVAEWRVEDATRFAHTLASGVYGPSGEAVLALMRLPKEHPATFHPGDFTLPLTDPPSAGGFPAAWSPAYKGGWGGSAQDPPQFQTSEIVVLDVGGSNVAIAVSFRPDVQPGSDDPGRTDVPRALAEVFSHIQRAIESVESEVGP